MSAAKPARRYAVILPACNEEPCLAAVLGELRAVLPAGEFEIAVGVNGSTDRTAEIARAAGALVAETPARGYGYGCQAAIERLAAERPPFEGFIFFAADGANDPRDIPRLVAEHRRGAALVLGARTRTPGNWSRADLHYVAANRLFGALCGVLTGRAFADLGPLRLIDAALWRALGLREWTYGWTIEAQVRAVRLDTRIVEIPVRERGRLAGEQKVSRVAWRHTLAVGLHIAAAGWRARFGVYEGDAEDKKKAPGGLLRTPPLPAFMKRLLLALLVASLASAGHAQQAAPVAHPGSSMHGEAFNEGPRQAAVLMDGTGDVHFPVTTRVPAAQKFIDQGVGQLHGFWYFEAERSFRQAAALDGDCAIAYWGMAQANANNPKRAAEFIKEAVKRRDKATKREQMWIDGLAEYHGGKNKDEKLRRTALIRALEELVDEFPEDLEAKAFLVLQVWDNSKHGLPLQSRRMLDGLCKEVLAKNPMHPGIHHYRIHVWNNQNGDKRAVDSALRCGQTAPAIAHMWHMSGHTFSNLRRYAEAAWQQEASARVDHAHMIAARLMPDQIHNFAHNNDWLVRNLGYLGRVRDGVDLAKNMIELPRLPSRNSTSFTLGRERLPELLLRFEKWDELTALDGTLYLEASDNPVAEAQRLRALGVAYFAKGDRPRAEAKLSALEAALTKARDERLAAADAAESKAKGEKKSDDEIARAMADAMRKFSTRIDITTGLVAELRTYRALADVKLDAAKAGIDKTRDISAERQARLWLQLGDKAKAERLAREAIGKDDQQVQPLANLAWVLWECGKRDEAKQTFKKLRAISASLDLDLPCVTRLAPIVQALDLPADWRPAAAAPSGPVPRPALESLGPFRWHPSPAPEWSLADSEGRAHSLRDFQGRPVLLVFYLGSGCLGCMEQLNLFAPIAKEYESAGITLLAVSTDPAEALHATFAKAKDAAGFPFPILADPQLAAFKAYRAFDDFERIALHGVFLIDGEGLVRWQDISYQPFRDPRWLLGECRRLLSIPAARQHAPSPHAATGP
jgi:peroxiredoxin